MKQYMTLRGMDAIDPSHVPPLKDGFNIAKEIRDDSWNNVARFQV